MKVSRIEIETRAGKILLTIAEAKKLHADLNELFGDNIKIIDRTITIPDNTFPINPPWSPTPPFYCGTPIDNFPSISGETICMSVSSAS